MDTSGMYVGLDIGTTSIKVIVAEYLEGQLNVLGVGNERSAGLSRGVIVDIDKASEAIKRAVKTAEEKASIQIHDVIVGISANKLKIEPVSGMVAIGDQAREITDQDVRDVAAAAIIQNLPPEREIINLVPDEFIVDGFDGIKDPRSMVGVRLEMNGMLFTGPKTIVHNTKKAVEQAGLNPQLAVVSPIAQGLSILSDGEQDFGTVLLDLGGGQTTAAVIHDHRLKYAEVDPEGGDYITKDISVVLNTSLENAEKLKRNYGFADSTRASEDNSFPVDVVGQSRPTDISEQYLAEIIEARLLQIFDKLKAQLAATNALTLPGGIVLTGGVAALPGISDLVKEAFDVTVRVSIPDQMGLRHPSFTQALSLVNYRGKMSEVDLLVQSAVTGNQQLATHVVKQVAPQPAESQPTPERPRTTETRTKQPKKRGQGIKKFFSDFFD
ncbi:ATPase for cell division [Secundilactobacillus odoratitofui DSM 19909 = JCM 15043]|uniref:Cell division protein FtsA n=1 Tax=Secundilactobacillus odoratitofui DSM 19909 = JCM 15043 TaxID=1423776 RepID=A0A0R1LR68_9LACO|nr:cell division protein FtsA [Secundilactobacillus odoratitofui]KRK98302.1 ATPase for cell division [Secundilactobacillus odoratitofui DSM 19909 = JCM 15043]